MSTLDIRPAPELSVRAKKAQAKQNPAFEAILVKIFGDQVCVQLYTMQAYVC